MPQLPLPLSVDTLLISPPDKGCLLFAQKEQANVQHFDTSLSQTPIRY
jgi:hypothetical protein